MVSMVLMSVCPKQTDADEACMLMPLGAVKWAEVSLHTHAITHTVNILFIWLVLACLAAVYQHITDSWEPLQGNMPFQ